MRFVSLIRPPRGTDRNRRSGFTLIEVVLAIGIFALAILTLLGLLAPTLESVNDVINTSLAKGVISKVNTTLQTYDADGMPDDVNAFEEVFQQVANTGEWTLYAYQLKSGEVAVVDNAQAVTDALAAAASDIEDTFDGPLFMVLVSASTVNDEALITAQPLASGFVDDYAYYGLTETYDNWPEAYLALKIDIVTLATPPPNTVFNPPGHSGRPLVTDDAILFSYNTAVTR